MHNQIASTIRGLRESNQGGTTADTMSGIVAKAKEFDDFENFLAATTAEERAMIKQDPDYDGSEGIQDFFQKHAAKVPMTTGESAKTEQDADDKTDDKSDDKKSGKSDKTDDNSDKTDDNSDKTEDRVATEAEVLKFLGEIGLVPDEGGLPNLSVLQKARAGFVSEERMDEIRNVRNFWVTGTVDGTANPSLKGAGPKSKSGGFSLNILMREDGGISDKSLQVNGFAADDGSLQIDVEGPGIRGSMKTKR